MNRIQNFEVKQTVQNSSGARTRAKGLWDLAKTDKDIAQQKPRVRQFLVLNPSRPAVAEEDGSAV